MKNIAIIGGGISGLSAAITLNRNNIDFTLFEATDSVGGAIKTVREFDCIIECGPNSINGSNDDLKDLINYLELENECCYANNLSKNRYIIKSKYLLPVPLSFTKFLKTKLFSTQAKLRLIKEPFIKSKSTNNESVHDFIIRRLGKEILDYAVSPFIGGIYAGDPKKLSLKKSFPKLSKLEAEYGSIFKGMSKLKRRSSSSKIYTFKNGMVTLPKKIADHIHKSIKYNSPIEEIIRSDSGNWIINNKEFSHIILTQPAYTFADLHAPFDVSIFNKIYYPPVTSINLLYKQTQIEHHLDGFGVLVPECEKMFILGVLFPSIIFNNRSPENTILLTVFVGGSIHPERALLSEEELIKKIEMDLKTLIKLNGTAINKKCFFWKKAIPQYDMNIYKIHESIEAIEKENNGLYIIGNYRNGISIPDAVSSGKDTALRIIELK